ncbi:NAD(P)/FAD-dependent oxidoreductase [Candidatus Clostridium radicumherbarum]|uniref:NAD(P)/FAD-dependent oxidoreductase n=1 Tax=Candidatus Clostridium radicumherbarum TaxID=3381662 RepID=A0ABW8TUD6_9CLOT
MFDVTIIGAGVVGCSIARELSKYELKVCVLEKEVDLASGTTKANSAIIHAGFDAKPNTLKGKLNAKGNSMFDKLTKELNFPFIRNGSLVLCFDKNDYYKLIELKEQGEKNGVPDLQILDAAEIHKIEPNISQEVVAALYAPTGGIVCPYEFTIALAENAYLNGTEFKLGTKVMDIKKNENSFVINTNNGVIESNLIINAAGLFADDINNMVSANKLKIIPRKGEYCLFDKAAGSLVSKTIFQLPSALGKGVLVTPTVDGNLLIGPNAVDIEDKLNLATTKEGLDDILQKAKKSLKNIPMNLIITSFTGLRARTEADDFIIGETKDVKGFINAASIESPGLSSAPAIAEMIRNIVLELLPTSEKENFRAVREKPVKFRELTNEERKELIARIPEYGKIICRCEVVTEGEILDSIRGPLGATTLDGVKKRTRAGMGRCQSGFCTTRIVDILCRELKVPKTEITKFGGNSKLLVGRNKDNI